MNEERRACRGWLAAAILSFLLSVSALAQDTGSEKTIYDLPPVDESHIASKYKATLAKPPNVEWFLGAELGFLAVVSHIVQLGNDGTRFNYRDDGGQDVLFPFFRLSTDLKFKGRHAIVFLYQPLKLTGETVLSQDTTFDGVVFPAGTPLNSTYWFPVLANQLPVRLPAAVRRRGVHRRFASNQKLHDHVHLGGRHPARRSPQHRAGAGAQISGPLGL